MLSFDLFLSEFDMFVVFMILVVFSNFVNFFDLFLIDFDLFIIFEFLEKVVDLFLCYIVEFLFVVCGSVLDSNWVLFGEVEVVGFVMCKGFKF